MLHPGCCPHLPLQPWSIHGTNPTGCWAHCAGSTEVLGFQRQQGPSTDPKRGLHHCQERTNGEGRDVGLRHLGRTVKGRGGKPKWRERRCFKRCCKFHSRRPPAPPWTSGAQLKLPSTITGLILASSHINSKDCSWWILMCENNRAKRTRNHFKIESCADVPLSFQTVLHTQPSWARASTRDQLLS